MRSLRPYIVAAMAIATILISRAAESQDPSVLNRSGPYVTEIAGGIVLRGETMDLDSVQITRYRKYVTLTTPEITLRADEADFDPRTGELEVRGNIRLAPNAELHALLRQKNPDLIAQKRAELAKLPYGPLHPRIAQLEHEIQELETADARYFAAWSIATDVLKMQLPPTR